MAGRLRLQSRQCDVADGAPSLHCFPQSIDRLAGQCWLSIAFGSQLESESNGTAISSVFWCRSKRFAFRFLLRLRLFFFVSERTQCRHGTPDEMEKVRVDKELPLGWTLTAAKDRDVGHASFHPNANNADRIKYSFTRPSIIGSKRAASMNTKEGIGNKKRPTERRVRPRRQRQSCNCSVGSRSFAVKQRNSRRSMFSCLASCRKYGERDELSPLAAH